jgi:serine/threonine protein kinase
MLAPGYLVDNRFQIVEQIGEGGQGCVYKAKSLYMDGFRAIKHYHTRGEDEQKEFENEANILWSLTHNSIPKMGDFFTNRDGSFLIMNYIHGENLREVVVNGGEMDMYEVLFIAKKLLEILNFIHTHSEPVCHRDIKPSNIKVVEETVFLLDFGLAKVGETTIRPGGTPHFASLEQYRNERTDAQSDLYSLGATLYYLLTGANPPEAHYRDAMIVEGKPDPLRYVNEIKPQIPSFVARIIFKAMALLRKDRYINAKEMLGAITSQVDGGEEISHEKNTLVKETVPTSVGNYEKSFSLYPTYMQQVRPLRRLDEVTALSEWQDAEFNVALAEVSLSRKTKGINAFVSIPSNPYVAYNSHTRNILENKHQGSKRHHPGGVVISDFLRIGKTTPIIPMRVTAGGSLTVLRVPTDQAYEKSIQKGTKLEDKDYEQLIVLSKKDNVPNLIHARHLVPSSGMAESEQDWMNPLGIIVGECVEELMFVSEIDGTWFYPKFESGKGRRQNRSHIKNNILCQELNARAREEIEELLNRFKIYRESTWLEQKSASPPIKFRGFKECPAEIIELGRDELEITYNGEKESFKGLIVLDGENGAIDLMASVQLTLPIPLKHLHIWDGESKYNKTLGKVQMLWRNAFALSKEEFSNLFSGKKTNAIFFGRDADEDWRDRIPVRLSANPEINPPLFEAGIALLKKFGLTIEPFNANDVRELTIEFPKK